MEGKDNKHIQKPKKMSNQIKTQINNGEGEIFYKTIVGSKLIGSIVAKRALTQYEGGM